MTATLVEAPTQGSLGVANVQSLVEAKIDLANLPPSETLVGEGPIEELVEAIEAVGGLLEPIVLEAQESENTSEDNIDGLFLDPSRLIAGRRRIKALRELYRRADDALLAARTEEADEDTIARLTTDRDQWAKVPATIVISPEGVSNSTLLQILSHSTRRDNEPVTHAAIKRLQAAGYDDKAIMQATGLKPQTFKRYLLMDRLVPNLLRALYEGLYAPWVAFKCSSLSAELQEGLYQKLVKDGKLTSDDVNAVKHVLKDEAAADLPVDQIMAKGDEEREQMREGGDDLREALKLAHLRIAELETRLENLTSSESETEREPSAQIDTSLLDAQLERVGAELEDRDVTIKRLENEVETWKARHQKRKAKLPYPELAEEGE